MPANLLLEIGCEELPTSFLDGALAQLATLIPEELQRARIAHGAVKTLGTARRLATVVEGLADTVEPREEELLGPPESAARTPDGKWSRAAEGFAKKSEVSMDALDIVETPKGRYLRAIKRTPGARTSELLPDVLATVCRRISFTKSMRWADLDTAFGRPVQWLVALHGDAVIPFSFAGHTAGRATHGHRFLTTDGPFELRTADDYVTAMHDAKVLVDTDARRALLLQGLLAVAAEEGGTLKRDAFLEGEVLGLVERPHVICGHFEERFLKLPAPLIESVMRGHQRYFAVARNDDPRALLPVFLTVVNTALDPALIRKGNERVMRARLNDARFFVEKDRSEPLSARGPRLAGIVYHQKLGTYADKVLRVEALSADCAKVFGAEASLCTEAARLCKCDLVALTVGEFPELQGYVGRDLARNDGLDATVCEAIAEHYLPRGAEDSVALSKLGAALAVADRVDTLAGFFAIGQKPSGGGDPHHHQHGAGGGGAAGGGGPTGGPPPGGHRASGPRRLGADRGMS